MTKVASEIDRVSAMKRKTILDGHKTSQSQKATNRLGENACNIDHRYRAIIPKIIFKNLRNEEEKTKNRIENEGKKETIQSLRKI